MVRRQADNARHNQIFNRSTKSRLRPIEPSRAINIGATRRVTNHNIRTGITNKGRPLFVILIRRFSQNLKVFNSRLFSGHTNIIHEAVIRRRRLVQRSNLTDNIRRAITSTFNFIPH